MKILISVEINVPQEKLAALLADPANNQKWMTDLLNCTPLSGTPGKVGSTYLLVFKSGNREMTFTATTGTIDLPRELRISMENAMVNIDAVGTLTSLAPAKTRYTFEQNFQFNGVLQTIFGFLAKSTIKKQQQAHLEALKRYAETATD